MYMYVCLHILYIIYLCVYQMLSSILHKQLHNYVIIAHNCISAAIHDIEILHVMCHEFMSRCEHMSWYEVFVCVFIWVYVCVCVRACIRSCMRVYVYVCCVSLPPRLFSAQMKLEIHGLYISLQDLKNFEFQKEVGIAMKIKETRSYPVRNS